MKTISLQPGQCALVAGLGSDKELSFSITNEADKSSQESDDNATKLLFLMSGLIEIFRTNPDLVAQSASTFYDNASVAVEPDLSDNMGAVGGILLDLEMRGTD